MKGNLYLIPTLLADDTQEAVLPSSVKDSVRGLDHFLCENVRSARRFVSALDVHDSVEKLKFDLLDKDTSSRQIPKLLEPLLMGKNMGLLSESGCPGIADPGSLAVDYAHRKGIKVVPLVGPSSILLALMASGLNGQQFAFHGYLPIDSKQASTAIRELERESSEKNQTQIFIETPYRNIRLFALLLRSLRPDTQLCIASNLTAPTEQVICHDIGTWKKQTHPLEKVPVTFLFLARGQHAVNT